MLVKEFIENTIKQIKDGIEQAMISGSGSKVPSHETIKTSIIVFVDPENGQAIYNPPGVSYPSISFDVPIVVKRV